MNKDLMLGFSLEGVHQAILETCIAELQSLNMITSLDVLQKNDITITLIEFVDADAIFKFGGRYYQYLKIIKDEKTKKTWTTN